ncbi:hypothetical protein [Rickettsia oklahomensis]|uniref:Uncharacterized protein n=1 Tax=Rickettsia oklahomensis TaxID=3141789 RepID=A0AAU7BZ70_9RICK
MKEFEGYQKIKDDKVAEYRQKLVKNRMILSKKIEQYNNKHK